MLYQILGYILQLTDPDLTGNMPKELPKDFFIPDADYDAATGGGSDDKARSGDFDPPESSAFFTEVDRILKNANASSSTINAVHSAVSKEFGKISDDVAARIRRG